MYLLSFLRRENGESETTMARKETERNATGTGTGNRGVGGNEEDEEYRSIGMINVYLSCVA
ncbi:hypothetical protein WN51_12970 [Melipona quadrifasciata]|uniref:Uncharacterized protein n=1 Tax=Melipona quadrifasciata TaxID=166423 RepID=A0A0M9AAE4_9HYME|nr:hypothetical protein WN51_12970 [Melipona quadrifasciata]